MPRLSFTVLILCWTVGLVFFVRADAINRRSIHANKNPVDKDDASQVVSCECEIFIQSSLGPQLVRLPLGNFSKFTNQLDAMMRSRNVDVALRKHKFYIW